MIDLENNKIVNNMKYTAFRTKEKTSKFCLKEIKKGNCILLIGIIKDTDTTHYYIIFSREPINIKEKIKLYFQKIKYFKYIK